MSASVTSSPRNCSASAFSFCRIIALISGGAYSFPSASTRASPFGPLSTLYGTIVISSDTSSHLRPMKRLMEEIVFCGFVTCWRFAGAPTSRWPSFANATTDGVVRPPSAFGMTVGSPPSSTAIQDLFVPRSIPMVLPIGVCSFDLSGQLRKSKPQCINPLPGCNGQTGTMRRGRLALVLALAGALPASAAASTILGTPRAEALRGSARGDLIDAVGGGRDTVRCGGGIDTVMADAADRVAGDCELVAPPVAV